MDDLIRRHDAIDAICKHGTDLERSGITVLAVANHKQATVDLLEKLPSAQPEWNNHTVACLLAELFDDTCACNYNDIDEWLPEKCELLDSCPNPVGVACWEQFLKHKAERSSE